MIKLLRSGHYKLIETKNHVKVLYLETDTYAWPTTEKYGEMLVISHRLHKTDAILATGAFRLYEVKDEPNISDHIHLEFDVGDGIWQGYLLLTGLPDNTKQRGRIIATKEIITGNPGYVSHLADV